MGGPESWDQERLRLELRMHLRGALEGRPGRLSCSLDTGIEKAVPLEMSFCAPSAFPHVLTVP